MALFEKIPASRKMPNCKSGMLYVLDKMSENNLHTGAQTVKQGSGRMVQDLPHKLTLLHEFQKSRKDMEQK
jgi:hypothetical protein